MKKIVAVVSAKGGVGKSTVCANLAEASADLGIKTLIVELDAGARGLDIILGIDNIVFDLDDILFGRCALKDAIVVSKNNNNLSLLAAPAVFKKYPKPYELKVLCDVFLKKYENVILDVSAGYSMAQTAAKQADEVLILTTPDPVCIRDTALFADYLRKNDVSNDKLYMAVNMIDKEGYINGLYENVDRIMDDCGLKLRGVIPKSKKLATSSAKGQRMERGEKVSLIFDAMAKRINGDDAPLILKEL